MEAMKAKKKKEVHDANQPMPRSLNVKRKHRLKIAKLYGSLVGLDLLISDTCLTPTNMWRKWTCA